MLSYWASQTSYLDSHKSSYKPVFASGTPMSVITHNLLSLESILKMPSADLASILGIDQHVGEIISAAAKNYKSSVEIQR
jgi:hypothetical protein